MANWAPTISLVISFRLRQVEWRFMQSWMFSQTANRISSHGCNPAKSVTSQWQWSTVNHVHFWKHHLFLSETGTNIWKPPFRTSRFLNVSKYAFLWFLGFTWTGKNLEEISSSQWLPKTGWFNITSEMKWSTLVKWSFFTQLFWQILNYCLSEIKHIWNYHLRKCLRGFSTGKTSEDFPTPKTITVLVINAQPRVFPSWATVATS